MRHLGDRLRDRAGDGDDARGPCGCVAAFEGTTLVLDATDCPADGALSLSPDCRATAVGELAERDAEAVRVDADGQAAAYADAALALLVAAGRFVDRAAEHDPALAARATRDPLGAGRDAAARYGPVADVATETGLALLAADGGGYEALLRPRVGPTVGHTRVQLRPPPGADRRTERELPTGATVREYEGRDGAPRYHLEPLAARLDPGDGDFRALAAAHEHLADGTHEDDDRALAHAVRAVTDADAPRDLLRRLLARHARGLGTIEDLLADPAVDDVYAPSPAASGPLRVVLDGRSRRTNVFLTDDGAAALASRFRRASGRGFSRADPTVDATVTTAAGNEVRVAGVTGPASDGYGFALRPDGDRVFTLPALVANDTLTARAAALLSVAVERAAAGLVAGPRGAGKTTLLGALCWALPAGTRTVLVEDTPELPAAALAEAGRDVQPLRTSLDEGPGVAPAEALRAALRFGEGALVVGEVRGEEADVLYEAMRVGAQGSAVLGTIHGDGAAGVRERVVSDLGVPESSFAATDLVVTCEQRTTETGSERQVARIEEVREGGSATLFAREDGALEPTGLVARGRSHLVGDLARTDETYGTVLTAIDDRAALIERLVRDERTGPSAVVAAAHERR